ncbi:MAG: hypothetical protein IKD94_02610, partial [Erysipelotrichaceae bacterium]|nr:hypothetical protein [Erysipelotrichaceae bacterium]
LPLDVVVYIKASVVSSDRNTNYDFIRYLFTDENMPSYFKDLNDTIFYDFDGRNSGQEKVVTIFELYSLYNYENTSNYLQELLMYYDHEADVLIDFYTHDSKEYRLSNLDGIVKLEQMNVKN